MTQFGFNYNYDLRKVLDQLAITDRINRQFLQATLVRVKLGQKDAIDDWIKTKEGDVKIDLEADTPKERRVQYGYAPGNNLIDIDIDGRDARLARYVKLGLEFYGVDTRFAFGRTSMGVPTHFSVRWEGDPEDVSRFPIPALERNGKRLKVELLHANNKEKDTIRKQVVLPGGFYVEDDGIDLIRWYAEYPTTTMRVSGIRDIIRGASLGFMMYILEDYWTGGDRHIFAQKFTGWLASIIHNAESNPKGMRNTLSLILPEEFTA